MEYLAKSPETYILYHIISHMISVWLKKNNEFNSIGLNYIGQQ